MGNHSLEQICSKNSFLGNHYQSKPWRQGYRSMWKGTTGKWLKRVIRDLDRILLVSRSKQQMDRFGQERYTWVDIRHWM